MNNAVYMHPPGRILLKQRVLGASIWSLASYGFSQVFRFGSNLLMTRLLVPEMFGVMAIATVVMIGLAMFSDLGLRPSVVQNKRGNDPVFLNTAWVTQILRGLLLWLCALIAGLLVYLANRIGMAPPGSVYADTSLPFVITILSITAVTGGFKSTKLLEASRNLSLKPIAQIEITSQIAGLLFMLGWAFIDRSIWALVAGNICSGLIRTTLSHVWLPGVTNRWQWDKSTFREIAHFGKWMFISSILGFFVNNGDRLLLGGLVDARSLGVYTIAFGICASIDQFLSKIIVDVSFPALSEIVRERPADLKSKYYRFHIVIGSFAYFCSAVLMISGQTLIDFLYDRRYEQAGWMLEFLAAALLTAPFRIAVQSFIALGLPQLLAYISGIRLITLSLLTPIGFQCFGLPGALGGIVLSSFSWLPFSIFYQIKSGLFDLRKEFLLLAFALVGMAAGWIVNETISH